MDILHAKRIYDYILKKVREEHYVQGISDSGEREKYLQEKARDYLIDLQKKHREFMRLMDGSNMGMWELEDMLKWDNKVMWFPKESIMDDLSDEKGKKGK